MICWLCRSCWKFVYSDQWSVISWSRLKYVKYWDLLFIYLWVLLFWVVTPGLCIVLPVHRGSRVLTTQKNINILTTKRNSSLIFNLFVYFLCQRAKLKWSINHSLRLMWCLYWIIIESEVKRKLVKIIPFYDFVMLLNWISLPAGMCFILSDSVHFQLCIWADRTSVCNFVQ